MQLTQQSRSHFRFGWGLLLVFGAMGLLLEGLHGFKSEWYLQSPLRRTSLLLAHVHGVAFGLINVLFAATIAVAAGWPAGLRRLASACLQAASVLIPGGFLCGGVYASASQPAVGIVLIVPGALFLFLAVLLTALGCRRAGDAVT